MISKEELERFKKWVTFEKLIIYEMGKTPHIDSKTPWLILDEDIHDTY